MLKKTILKVFWFTPLSFTDYDDDDHDLCQLFVLENGTKYSRMDQVKFSEDSF